MGFTVAWIPWLGFLDSQDWALYSATGESLSLHSLDGAAGQEPEPAQLVL